VGTNLILDYDDVNNNTMVGSKSYNYAVLKCWPFSSFYFFFPKCARDASFMQIIFYANNVS